MHTLHVRAARLVFFAMIMAIGLLPVLAGCSGSDYDPETTDLLVIYTAHPDEAQVEFDLGFKEFYRSRTGREVLVRWPTTQGSSNIREELRTKHAKGIQDVDIVFGGGAIHADLKQMGLLSSYELPEAVMAELPAEVAGEPLYDVERTWYGAAISTFGIIVNEQRMADLKLPPVRDWSDLSRAQYYGLVGVADPNQSGSVRKMYEIILQSYGYEQGMRLLALQAANAPSISASAGEIPKSVAAAMLVAGPCIDFYAERQMDSAGGERLGFVAPAGKTVINADPVGILEGAPNRAQAELFVEFVMSRAGQQLWCLNAGVEGGPQKMSLKRKCVIPAIYVERAADLSISQNPFTDWAANDFFDSGKEERRIGIMPEYLQAMMISNQPRLAAAWKAIIDAGLPEELIVELTAPLIGEDEMLQLAAEAWDSELKRSELKTQWNRAFRARYEAVAQKARALRQ